jgi:hypothetical protein
MGAEKHHEDQVLEERHDEDGCQQSACWTGQLWPSRDEAGEREKQYREIVLPHYLGKQKAEARREQKVEMAALWRVPFLLPASQREPDENAQHRDFEGGAQQVREGSASPGNRSRSL